MKTVKKGTEVKVLHILGETAERLLTPINGQFRFSCDAYVVGTPVKGGFFHLRQAREIIPGKKLGNNFKKWPRLRRALLEAGVKPVHIPGGDIPIHYDDEIVIPNFSMSGAGFFVIKKSEIGTYLSKLPLDEKGQARASAFKKAEEAAAAEAYRQEHDPKCIAKRIGYKLWDFGGIGGEFTKITMVAADGSEYSVIYPSWSTDLRWSGGANVAKILCAAPETGIEYLSGWTAGHLDPRKHHRIKQVYSEGWHKYCGYLMPNPDLATEVREFYRWLRLFDGEDNDGAPAELIASAQKVILEGYDLNDRLLKERIVYDKSTQEVRKEALHNWPFSILTGKLIGDLDWRPVSQET